jgi:hypothetical protein
MNTKCRVTDGLPLMNNIHHYSFLKCDAIHIFKDKIWNEHVRMNLKG